MRGFVLADWTTLRGTSATTGVTQSVDAYLDLAAYQDFTAWVELGDFVSGGATSPKILLESAPLKDEVLFSPSGWSQPSAAMAVGVTVVKSVFATGLATQIPLSRYLRWRVDMAGASSTWSVTFRIYVAAHSVCLPD